MLSQHERLMGSIVRLLGCSQGSFWGSFALGRALLRHLLEDVFGIGSALLVPEISRYVAVLRRAEARVRSERPTKRALVKSPSDSKRALPTAKEQTCDSARVKSPRNDCRLDAPSSAAVLLSSLRSTPAPSSSRWEIRCTQS